MPTKNSRTLTLEEIKEQYEFIQDNELKNDVILKVKGEEISVQDIIGNLLWMLMYGETTADFHCCKPGCTDYPCPIDEEDE